MTARTLRTSFFIPAVAKIVHIEANFQVGHEELLREEQILFPCNTVPRPVHSTYQEYSVTKRSLIQIIYFILICGSPISQGIISKFVHYMSIYLVITIFFYSGLGHDF